MFSILSAVAILCLTGCSEVTNEIPYTIGIDSQVSESLEQAYTSVFAIEDGFREKNLTQKYSEGDPTFLSNLRESYAKLDSELETTAQFSDIHEFAKLRSKLFLKYGAISFFVSFGCPILDSNDSVLYVSAKSITLKEFIILDSKKNRIKVSSLLKYRIRRADLD